MTPQDRERQRTVPCLFPVLRYIFNLCPIFGSVAAVYTRRKQLTKEASCENVFTATPSGTVTYKGVEIEEWGTGYTICVKGGFYQIVSQDTEKTSEVTKSMIDRAVPQYAEYFEGFWRNPCLQSRIYQNVSAGLRH